MKSSKRKSKNNMPSASEKRWEKLAAFYEDNKSLAMLENSKPLTIAEMKFLAKKSRTKPISIRIPEFDLIALKNIAKKTNNGKYQQLIIQAIEQFIEKIESKKAA